MSNSNSFSLEPTNRPQCSHCTGPSGILHEMCYKNSCSLLFTLTNINQVWSKCSIISFTDTGTTIYTCIPPHADIQQPYLQSRWGLNWCGPHCQTVPSVSPALSPSSLPLWLFQEPVETHHMHTHRVHTVGRHAHAHIKTQTQTHRSAVVTPTPRSKMNNTRPVKCVLYW